MDKFFKAVYNAWHKAGPVPTYHFYHQQQLRAQWPTLAKALDALPDPSKQSVLTKKGKHAKFGPAPSQYVTVRLLVEEIDPQNGPPTINLVGTEVLETNLNQAQSESFVKNFTTDDWNSVAIDITGSAIKND